MNLKRFTLATIITALIVFVFSSCTDDDDHYAHWEKAYISSVITDIPSDREGWFEGSYDIDVTKDTYDLNDRAIGRYVEDIAYRGGDIIIVADEPMDKLVLYLYTPGGVEVSSIVLENIRSGENEFTGRGVVNFLDVVTAQLRRTGYVEIDFEGLSNGIRLSYIDIDIYMDIDAYVRN